jgi:curved DNA-binding protein CbpA
MIFRLLTVHEDYDLVRIYHPDSPSCRLDPPDERHRRFQAIRTAYDALRKGTAGTQTFDIYAQEVARRKRMYQRQYARRAAYAAEGRYDWNSNPDDRWKDQMIIAFGLLVSCPSPLLLAYYHSV